MNLGEGVLLINDQHADDEEALTLQTPNTLSNSSLSAWSLIQKWFEEKLFGPLATAVCIFNVSSALGFVMLMNDSAELKDGYTLG